MVGVNWFWTVNGEQITDPGYANHVANKKSYYLGLAQNQLINMKRINSITQPGLRKFKFTQHYNNECAITTDVGPGYEKIFVDILIDLPPPEEKPQKPKEKIETESYIIYGEYYRDDDHPTSDSFYVYYKKDDIIEEQSLIPIENSLNWSARFDPPYTSTKNACEAHGGDINVFPLMHFRFADTEYVNPLIIGVDSITGISEDGTYICGNNNGYAYRWNEESGVVNIGSFVAYNISADGSTIVGTDPDTYEAIRWNEKEGVQVIPRTYTSDYAAGTAASRDGSVIVGNIDRLFPAPYGDGYYAEVRAFMWTEKTGMVDLGSLPLDDVYYGGLRCMAHGVSDDGMVVVGQSNGQYRGASPDAGISPITWQSWVWTEEMGMLSLGQFSGSSNGVTLIAIKKDEF